MLVHAHPDDECLSTGGAIARYAAEGVHVCLITCTNGELGEIAELPELGPPESLRARLAEIRVAELHAACEALGPVDLRLLGYRDSGMEGTPGNADPAAFVQQPFEEVVGRITAILREVRPQVLVTYNEYGFYGHPDHIRAHDAAMAAVAAAADPAYDPGSDPHEVAKIYHTAIPKERLRRARELFSQGPLGDDDRFSEEEIERIGTDDHLVTTDLDVRAYVPGKIAAIEAHRTQLGTTVAFLSVPDELRSEVFGHEQFVLVHSIVGSGDGIERDLFERLTDPAG